MSGISTVRSCWLGASPILSSNRVGLCYLECLRRCCVAECTRAVIPNGIVSTRSHVLHKYIYADSYDHNNFTIGRSDRSDTLHTSISRQQQALQLSYGLYFCCICRNILSYECRPSIRGGFGRTFGHRTKGHDTNFVVFIFSEKIQLALCNWRAVGLGRSIVI